jgi:hypothetical protein
MLSEQFNNLMRAFTPIHLEQMDRVKLMNRVDTKFAIDRKILSDILPELVENYAILEINSVRTPSYQSQYFDDQHLTFYKDHHNGRTNRFKVRIRKYIESNLLFLEIKHKYKGRTNKKRIEVDDFKVNLTSEMNDFISDNKAAKAALMPILENTFHRITLVNKTKNERLTFDFDLSFRRENTTKEFKNLVIAELKQEKIDRTSPFFVAMKNRIIRPYRLSKYCFGAMALYEKEKIKINRFKRKYIYLQQIEKYAC